MLECEDDHLGHYHGEDGGQEDCEKCLNNLPFLNNVHFQIQIHVPTIWFKLTTNDIKCCKDSLSSEGQWISIKADEVPNSVASCKCNETVLSVKWEESQIEVTFEFSFNISSKMNGVVGP